MAGLAGVVVGKAKILISKGDSSISTVGKGLGLNYRGYNI